MLQMQFLNVLWSSNRKEMHQNTNKQTVLQPTTIQPFNQGSNKWFLFKKYFTSLTQVRAIGYYCNYSNGGNGKKIIPLLSWSGSRSSAHLRSGRQSNWKLKTFLKIFLQKQQMQILKMQRIGFQNINVTFYFTSAVNWLIYQNHKRFEKCLNGINSSWSCPVSCIHLKSHNLLAIISYWRLLIPCLGPSACLYMEAT